MTDTNFTTILRELIRQQAYLATRCACGKLGDARDGDRLLCAQCWIARFDAERPAPEDAIASCEAYLNRAQELAAGATTLAEHIAGRQWIANATRNLARWRARREREARG